MLLKKVMIFLAVAVLSTQALAASKTRILYMEVDQGQDMLSRHDPAFRRVFDHTGNYLHHEKIRLFEEKCDTSQARSFAQAMDIASLSKQKKLDAIVLVSLKHKNQTKHGKLNDQLIAIAKIIDAKTLQLVETVRIKSPRAVLSKKRCGPSCQDMIIRRHVREILPAFKGELADKLVDYAPRYAKARKPASQVTLTLKGFKPREVYYLEDRIQALAGTRDLSTLASRADKPAYWLERSETAGDLQSELSDVLAGLNLQARIIQTEKQVVLIKVDQDMAALD